MLIPEMEFADRFTLVDFGAAGEGYIARACAQGEAEQTGGVGIENKNLVVVEKGIVNPVNRPFNYPSAQDYTAGRPSAMRRIPKKITLTPSHCAIVIASLKISWAPMTWTKTKPIPNWTANARFMLM